MKRFLYSILIITGCILFTSALTGCQSNSPDNPDDSNDDMVEVSILISNSDIINKIGNQQNDDYVGTRVFTDNSDANYTDVYLVAAGEKMVRSIPLKDRLSDADGYGFREALVSLTPDKYRFYIVANINSYISNVLEQYVNTEDDIKNLVLNFNNYIRLESGNLPMACLPSEVTGTGTTKDTDYRFDVKRETDNIQLTAVMRFLCAKVRYTILYDAREGGISNEFRTNSNNSAIRFSYPSNPPYASNVKGIQDVIEKDYTYLLPNSDFNAKDASNWSTGSSVGLLGFGDGVAEFYYETWAENKKTYDLNRVVQDGDWHMPSGYYRLDVQGFFRNGYGDDKDKGYPALTRHQEGTEKLMAEIYIRDYNNSNNIATKPLMSLYSERCSEGRPREDYPYPQNTAQANTAFNKEHKYNNSVSFYHQGSDPLVIGVRKLSSIPDYSQYGDWTCFDNFRVYYQGVTAPEDTEYKWDMPMGKFTYNMTQQELQTYPRDAYDNRLIQWSGTDENWYRSDCKAWQGVTYLPERLNSNTDLVFPYNYASISDIENDPFEEKRVTLPEVVRGKMYDVVIHVVHPDAIDILEVYVKDWDYRPEETIWQ